MKFLLSIFCLTSLSAFAQHADSSQLYYTNYAFKDDRIDLLGKKEAEINEANAKLLEHTALGYRLQVLSTNDRELAMKTKSDLLQKFPEQKTYLFYQSPYVKIRFGNFKTKPDAEIYRKQISKMLGGASIYLIPERIEVKPEKDTKEEEDK